MALQGNLRDFSAMEILQLLGSQKKSGCLTMEWSNERFLVWVIDGRVVSTRQPGLSKDDPLAQFLQRVHRLSDEQFRGLLTIQKESGRDLEDLLVKGRYLEADELRVLVERQILDDLMHLVRWENGNYRFDPNSRWPGGPLVSLSMEGVIMEAARRVDEQRRFAGSFRDPLRLLSVRDLPDPTETLSDEELEIFGIVDGQHTVAEVVDAVPMVEFEAYESLNRMLEAGWIEFTGRRDPALPVAPSPALAPAQSTRPTPAWLRELLVGLSVVAGVLGVLSLGAHVPTHASQDPATDVFASADLRELRQAVELFEREQGSYPRTLDAMVEDRWIEARQLHIPGYEIHYLVHPDGRGYQLELTQER